MRQLVIGSCVIKHSIRQTFANIEQGVREPKTIGPMFREGAIKLWQSRGGGLYGLGYVATFVSLEVLEIPELITDVLTLFAGDASMPGALFALGVDFFVDALVNMVNAFIWPALLIQAFGIWGVMLVAVGFATFNRFLRPIVERLVPELKIVRENKEKEKEERQADKLLDKASKKERKRQAKLEKHNEKAKVTRNAPATMLKKTPEAEPDGIPDGAKKEPPAPDPRPGTDG